MKPRCQHRYQIAGFVDKSGKRIFTLKCSLCQKIKTQKRQIPRYTISSQNCISSQSGPKGGMVSLPSEKAATRQKPRKVVIRPVSEKRKEVNKEYSRLRAEFLTAHPKCQVEGCKCASDQIHHKSRRHGKLLLDTSTWMACCWECHRQIEDNPAWAKAQGYLLPIFS